jgi:Protein of unknown function (DUF3617)
LFVVAAFAMPAAAADMPSRKAGLWEIKTQVANHPMTMRQCIDATTDQAMQSHAASSGTNCSRRDVQKTATRMTVDSVCTVAGKTVTSHIVVNGSFDSNYTMAITSEGGALPEPRTITLEAKMDWPLRGGSKTRRHHYVERRQDEHRRYAEAETGAGLAGSGARAVIDATTRQRPRISSIRSHTAEGLSTCG